MKPLRGLGPLFVTWAILGLSMALIYRLGQPLDLFAFWILGFIATGILRKYVYRRNGFWELLVVVLIGTAFATSIVFILLQAVVSP